MVRNSIIDVSASLPDHEALDSLPVLFFFQEMWTSEPRNNESKEHDFKTVCHGEPWYGNVHFRYQRDEGRRAEEEVEEEEPPWYPVQAAIGDLHVCSYGRPGSDLAHFLLTSTTREFRRQYLDTVLKVYLAELEDVVQSLGENNNNESVSPNPFSRAYYIPIFSIFPIPPGM